MSGVTETTGTRSAVVRIDDDDWITRLDLDPCTRTKVITFGHQLYTAISQNPSTTYLEKYHQVATQCHGYDRKIRDVLTRMQPLMIEWQNANSTTKPDSTLRERTVNMFTEVEQKNQELDRLQDAVRDTLAYISPAVERAPEFTQEMSKLGCNMPSTISGFQQLYLAHDSMKEINTALEQCQRALLTARAQLVEQQRAAAANQ